MRKILAVLIMLFISVPCYGDMFTNNYNLQIPSDDSVDWSGKISNDIVSIDTILGIISRDVIGTDDGVISGDGTYIYFDPADNGVYKSTMSLTTLQMVNTQRVAQIENAYTDYIQLANISITPQSHYYYLRLGNELMSRIYNNTTTHQRYQEVYGLLKGGNGEPISVDSSLDMKDYFIKGVQGITVDTIIAYEKATMYGSIDMADAYIENCLGITADVVSADRVAVNMGNFDVTANTPLSADIQADGTISADVYHFDILTSSPDVNDLSAGLYVSPDAAGGSSILFFDGSHWRKVQLI